MLEWLGIIGIGVGIKAAADGVQSAGDRTVRKATKAAKKAGNAAREMLDAAGPYSPLEHGNRGNLCAHRDEVIEDDGPYVKVRCTKCGRTAKGCA